MEESVGLKRNLIEIEELSNKFERHSHQRVNW